MRGMFGSLTTRGRSFVAAGGAAMVCGLAIPEPALVRVGALLVVLPLKGQLTVMVPQPEVQYHTNGGVPPVPGASLGIHMMARSDGIVLGGTSQRGVWTLEPDEAERKRVVDSHIAVFSAMKGARLA